MSAATYRIGARGSPLSLRQTELVRAALEAANPDLRFVITPIVTTGDQVQDRALSEIGGKGLFTKELDDALLYGRVDLAVHSMKDVPTVLPEGLVLACTPAREDPRDALVATGEATSLSDLPVNARIGTASLRRQAQLLALHSSFQIVMLRGNVETRLRRVAEGEIDATLLAYSGLRRLGLEARISAMIDPKLSPPAAGQGTLALVTRADDNAVIRAVRKIDDQSARLESAAERGFLAALDGSCKTPIAALGRWADGQLSFIGESLRVDGSKRWRRTTVGLCSSVEEARALGEQQGLSIKAEAGSALYTV